MACVYHKYFVLRVVSGLVSSHERHDGDSTTYIVSEYVYVRRRKTCSSLTPFLIRFKLFNPRFLLDPQ